MLARNSLKGWYQDTNERRYFSYLKHILTHQKIQIGIAVDDFEKINSIAKKHIL